MGNPDLRSASGGGITKKSRRLALLRFRPGNSFLHRLDPRTKILMVIIVSIAALVFGSFLPLLLLCSFVLTLAVTSRLGTALARALTLVLPLLILVIVLDSLFSKSPSGTVWFSAQIWILHPEVTTGGILFALTMGIRFLALAGISFLFVMTTSPDDLVRSLRGMRIPASLTFSLGYALRSITVLTDDTRQIIDAQRSRGLELDRGSAIKSSTRLAALFTPVTVSLLKRSKNTADAMQARGFCQSENPSCYQLQKFGRDDAQMAALLGVLIMALVFVASAPGGGFL